MIMIQYVNFKSKTFAAYLAKTIAHKKAIFIDEKVYSAFYSELFSTVSTDVFVLPSQEQIKTRAMKEQLEDQLFDKGYTKDSLFIAIGGGTVSDLIGYIASTFCRGVPLILVPTTLVGMIDACIGGKNGINTRFGKNLLGTIYLPLYIWIDPIFLSTLSPDQIQEGLVEMIKHGLIFDQKYFEEIIHLKQKPTLDQIQRSIQIKQAFVSADLKDKSVRQILNFGHTFAHGLEKLSSYTLSHGKAVAAGILIESYISYLEKDLSEDDFKIVYRFIHPLINHDIYRHYPMKDWLQSLLLDKKNKQDQIYTVRLQTIGKAILPKQVKESTLIHSIQWFEKRACVCS